MADQPPASGDDEAREFHDLDSEHCSQESDRSRRGFAAESADAEKRPNLRQLKNTKITITVAGVQVRVGHISTQCIAGPGRH